MLQFSRGSHGENTRNIDFFQKMAIKFLIFERELVDFVCRGDSGVGNGFLEILSFKD
jgi:hypothetical protein